MKHSPVPGILIFDQPSQVYFPKRLAARPETDEDPQLTNDEDVQAVQKAFRAMAIAVAAANNSLQVVLLDHASETLWGGIAGMHLVDEWRNGKKLVPMDWIQQPRNTSAIEG